MLAANTLSSLNNSYTKLTQYQNEVSTGKKITKPSDDPIATLNGMNYTSELNSISQFQKNVTSLQSWISNSEAGITQATNDISRIRTLVVQAANGTLNSGDLKTVATEVDQIQQDLVNTANTQVAGQYIFHGTDVTKPPVTQDNGKISVDNNSGSLNIEVLDGVSIPANANQSNVFSQNLFDTIGKIQTALQNNDTGSLSNDISSLDSLSSSIAGEQADLGARSNRVDTISNRLAQMQTAATKGLSDNMDADMESSIVNLTTQQSVYQAALSVGAKIIQPSLVNYLN
jgi:flagellar hook-associated protein 3 FlgL